MKTSRVLSAFFGMMMALPLVLLGPAQIGFAIDAAAEPAGSASTAEALVSPTRQAPLQIGDEAPDFSLPSADGEEVQLKSFRGKNTVVLYFYPKDLTPGCTKEAESFRDSLDRFKKAGAVVLGVSVDDLNSHKQFTKKMSLNFPLLADIGGSVSRKYGVMGWIMDKRVTYVIGQDGKIKMVYPDVDVSIHSKEVLKVVQDLAPPKNGPAKSKSKINAKAPGETPKS